MRREVAAPVAALAAKYWAVREHARPIRARSTRTPPILRMYPLSLPRIPTSTMRATTRGTNSSKLASSILNSGPSMLSSL